MGWKQRLVEIHEQEIARRQHLADDMRAGAFKFHIQDGATGEMVDISIHEIERNERVIQDAAEPQRPTASENPGGR